MLFKGKYVKHVQTNSSYTYEKMISSRTDERILIFNRNQECHSIKISYLFVRSIIYEKKLRSWYISVVFHSK